MGSNNSNSRFKQFFSILLLVLVGSVALLLLSLLPSHSPSSDHWLSRPLDLQDVAHAPVITISDDKLSIKEEPRPSCSAWQCIDVWRCGGPGLKVYVYPINKWRTANGQIETDTMSEQMRQILQAVISSEYYTPDPKSACLYMPSIDLLNQRSLHRGLTEAALHTLPYWEDGQNHLIFNMLPGSPPEFNTSLDINIGKAVLAGAGFDTWTYRPSFDVSIPLFSIDTVVYDNIPSSKSYLVVSSQVNLNDDHFVELKDIAETNSELLLLGPCNNGDDRINYATRCDYKSKRRYNYPEVLKHAQFCIMTRGARLAQPILLESMAVGCIPVIIADSIVMPFESVIDWHRAAVFIPEDNLNSIMSILTAFSEERKLEMSHQSKWLYDNYFASMEKITLTTLKILNDRIFPLMAKSYEQWNLPPNLNTAANPLFLPVTAPKAPGFTAVILTYDRVESLFLLINKLVKTPSLQKVLVIWNNQKKSPPPAYQWPTISKPLKVIQTKENKLSNRFYPYDEIETECLLTIDDDIVMLTPDELEFGFEVWREFPDRIVGFPSRVHLWDNTTKTWKYHSEWTNQISMVLTGAAFHHKIWSWYYTVKMPQHIRDWIDENMNCEDIAMNFLVANLTNKPPIKVAPRKKFKCPECTNTEMLSADIGHMTERSACVDKFANVYGRMALKTVEFRADPVLFRDNFPQKLKWFNDIGSL